MAILQDLSVEALQAQLAALVEENTKLKAAKSNGHGFKVTAKGGVSMYGLGRFPVTLYNSQWLALIDRIPDLQAFLTANADKLATKGE
jgi:hypothetical protein